MVEDTNSQSSRKQQKNKHPEQQAFNEPQQFFGTIQNGESNILKKSVYEFMYKMHVKIMMIKEDQV